MVLLTGNPIPLVYSMIKAHFISYSSLCLATLVNDIQSCVFPKQPAGGCVVCKSGIIFVVKTSKMIDRAFAFYDSTIFSLMSCPVDTLVF